MTHLLQFIVYNPFSLVYVFDKLIESILKDIYVFFVLQKSESEYFY